MTDDDHPLVNPLTTDAYWKRPRIRTTREDDENLLRGQITVEQLLLAASVLSAQNPQGPDFERKKLLEDAHELALEARSMAFKTIFRKNLDQQQWRRFFRNFGYDRYKNLDFVTKAEAAIEITGLKTKKQAVARFDRLINECQDLKTMEDLIERHGVWKDLIPELKDREKKHFGVRDKHQRRISHSASRRLRKKNSKKVFDSLSEDSTTIR